MNITPAPDEEPKTLTLCPQSTSPEKEADISEHATHWQPHQTLTLGGLAPDAVKSGFRRSDEHMEFIHGLKVCNSLLNIQRLAFSLKITLGKTPTCSRLAFNKLLKVGPHMGTLLSFLEDSSLNAPEAHNLLKLLERLTEQFPITKETTVLANWIRRQIVLGLLSENEITSFVKFACSIPNTAGNDSLKLNVLEMIWDGLRSSPVRKIHDLEGQTLNALLGSLSHGTLTPKLRDMGSEIVRHSSLLQLQHMDASVSTFLELLTTSWDKMGDNGERETNQSHVCVRVMELLDILPRELTTACLTSLTRRLVQRCRLMPDDGSSCMGLLNVWWHTLFTSKVFETIESSSKWSTLERFLSYQKTEIFGSYLRFFDDEKKLLIIKRHWLVPQRTRNHAMIVSKVPLIENRLEELCGAGESVSPFLIFLLANRYVTLKSDIVSRLLSLLRILDKPNIIAEIIRFSRTWNIHINAQVICDEITEHLKKTPSTALNLFRMYPWLPLEACPGLAAYIVSTPILDHDYVFRLWSSRTANAVSFYESSGRLPEARRQLFQTIALAFADAAYLIPRQAFRKVHRCYLIFRKERLGPLTPEMSRALTIAGVTRQLQVCQWVSTMKLKWILSHVRETEGDEVADNMDEIVYRWRGDVIRTNNTRMYRERYMET